MTDKFVKANAAVGENPRHIRAEEGIGYKDERNGQHRPADCAACCFKDHEDTNDAHDDICLGIETRTQDQFLVVQEQIACGANP